MIVRMWEATAAAGRLSEALDWVRGDLVPRALGSRGCTAAEIFKSESVPPRVVLVTRWETPPRFEEGVPADGVVVRARAAHFTTA